MSEEWHIYIVRCRDGTLYTGIATDVARRLAEHASAGARGSRYLRGRGPLELALQLAAGTRGEASRLEHRIKRLSRAEKDALLADPTRVLALRAPAPAPR